jgi:hypothetical protein
MTEYRITQLRKTERRKINENRMTQRRKLMNIEKSIIPQKTKKKN